eukprot:465102-Pelagomonas_calceolata.AAC.6
MFPLLAWWPVTRLRAHPQARLPWHVAMAAAALGRYKGAQLACCHGGLRCLVVTVRKYNAQEYVKDHAVVCDVQTCSLIPSRGMSEIQIRFAIYETVEYKTLQLFVAGGFIARLSLLNFLPRFPATTPAIQWLLQLQGNTRGNKKANSRQPWPAALAAAAASGGCKGCQDGLQPGIAADQLAAAMAPEGAPTAPHVAMAAAA